MIGTMPEVKQLAPELGCSTGCREHSRRTKTLVLACYRPSIFANTVIAASLCLHLFGSVIADEDRFQLGGLDCLMDRLRLDDNLSDLTHEDKRMALVQWRPLIFGFSSKDVDSARNREAMPGAISYLCTHVPFLWLVIPSLTGLAGCAVCIADDNMIDPCLQGNLQAFKRALTAPWFTREGSGFKQHVFVKGFASGSGRKRIILMKCQMECCFELLDLEYSFGSISHSFKTVVENVMSAKKVPSVAETWYSTL